MGNPAGDKRKLKEKRRMRHEARLGPGAYLPKEQRAELQAELKKIVEAEAAAAKESAAKRAEAKAAKAKAKADAAKAAAPA